MLAGWLAGWLWWPVLLATAVGCCALISFISETQRIIPVVAFSFSLSLCVYTLFVTTCTLCIFDAHTTVFDFVVELFLMTLLS